MNENKIIAAILTVAYNAAFVRDTVEPETVVHTYETFQKLLPEKERKEKEASIPKALRPLIDSARKRGR